MDAQVRTGRGGGRAGGGEGRGGGRSRRSTSGGSEGGGRLHDAGGGGGVAAARGVVLLAPDDVAPGRARARRAGGPGPEEAGPPPPPVRSRGTGRSRSSSGSWPSGAGGPSGPRPWWTPKKTWRRCSAAGGEPRSHDAPWSTERRRSGRHRARCARPWGLPGPRTTGGGAARRPAPPARGAAPRALQALTRAERDGAWPCCTSRGSSTCAPARSLGPAARCGPGTSCSSARCTGCWPRNARGARAPRPAPASRPTASPGAARDAAQSGLELGHHQAARARPSGPTSTSTSSSTSTAATSSAGWWPTASRPRWPKRLIAETMRPAGDRRPGS